jgi:4-hydroxy-2-oxoheptanedioate aldolase
VLRAIDDGIAAVLAAGKAPGILATNPERARAYLAAGVLFVAVGFDTTLLARGARSLAADFGRSPPR